MTDAPTRLRSPGRTALGWPEILIGAAVYAASYVLVAVLLPLVEDPAVSGIVGLFVSGIMGLLALAVAALIRIRGLSAFGFRKAKPRHLIVGALLGLVAYALGIVAALVYASTTGDAENVQGGYQAAAGGGAWFLILSLIAGAVVTPLGEEGFFRGVIANGLLAKLGPWGGILISAAIFAVAHGINPIMAVAFVVGILTALLFRWSRSIWPGMVLHAVNNATALLVPVLVGA